MPGVLLAARHQDAHETQKVEGWRSWEPPKCCFWLLGGPVVLNRATTRRPHISELMSARLSPRFQERPQMQLSDWPIGLPETLGAPLATQTQCLRVVALDVNLA